MINVDTILEALYERVADGGVVMIRFDHRIAHEAQTKLFSWIAQRTGSIDIQLNMFGDLYWWWIKHTIADIKGKLVDSMSTGSCLPTQSNSGACVCPTA